MTYPYLNAIEAGLNKSTIRLSFHATTPTKSLSSDLRIRHIASALLGSDHYEKHHGINVQKQ
jgi:hypothetical protein